MAEKTKIAYVLAGGQSRRMGTNKLSLVIDGISLLEHTARKCAACFDQVKLVAPQSDNLLHLGYPVVLDSLEAFGPMAGVIAALECCPNQTCFVTAADLYDLGVEIIASLTSQYRGQQFFGLRERMGIQPLCGIYHKSALSVLLKKAKCGEYGMADALSEMDIETISLPPGQWRNLNRPEDLAAVEGYNG